MSIAKYSEEVKFEPWIDVSNFAIGRPRLLFVGESHYTKPSQASNRDLTREVVELARNGKLTKKSGARFFTNIVAMSEGKLLLPEAKKAWWPKVAFYNYIQSPVGSKSRTRLNLKKFTEAHGAFHEVLSVVQPDIVVILGVRIWKHMSDKGAEKLEALATDSIDPKYCELWSYRTSEGRSALVFHVKHPSAGFNFRKFHPLLREAINRYKSKR